MKVAVTTWELPSESYTVTEVANVPLADPGVAAAFRFKSNEKFCVTTGGCTVPVGIVMLPGGALVFKTPLTCVQPCTVWPVAVWRSSLLVRLEVTGAGVFGGIIRSLNHKETGALNGRIERAASSLNCALREQCLGGRRPNPESNLGVSEARTDGLGYKIVEGYLAGFEPDRV